MRWMVCGVVDEKAVAPLHSRIRKGRGGVRLRTPSEDETH